MKKRYIFLIIVLLSTAGLAFLGRQTADPNRKIVWAATFDDDFAIKLGLDWQKAFTEILDDLKVRKIRLVAHWTEVEPQEGKFDYSKLDWQVAEAQKRKVRIIMAVGSKLPRWPECHIPDWAANNRQNMLLKYIEATVNRYKGNSSIAAWQVENEPFLPFGECPKSDAQFLDKEIALVKKLDARPIVITDSGELSIWVPAAGRADIFGTTMYRWVWNQYLGSYKYPIPPSFFRVKERLARLFVGRQKPFMVIELQGEPWTHKQIYEIPVSEQLNLMPLPEFNATIDYARQTGFSEYYFWGAEWWYYLKQQGHPEYWDRVKELINY
ncbi:MAG: beta-galactosidase [Candidatus Portnoybacteria bacterium]|nr:beta-galactosidase [Candidatus Portnoybacteria bacterium]MDD4982530.1 beta-galactosidase [Candidatus Portnoybacteria bacterium]